MIIGQVWPAKTEDSCSSENPPTQKGSWLIPSIQKVLLTLGGLYGLARWTITKKQGELELATWIGGKYAQSKKNPKTQIVFFRGVAADDLDPDPYQAEVLFSKFLPENKYRFFAPAFKCRRRFISYAQKWDIFQCKKNLEAIFALKENDQVKTIVFAQCNGASTLIATLFSYPELANKIAGIILFAPYDDISEVGNAQKIPKQLYSKTIIKRSFQAVCAPNYSPRQPTPCQLIATKTVRADLPIVLVHAADDHIIPSSEYEKIRDCFMAHGYTCFHAIQRNVMGHHSYQVWRDSESQEFQAQLQGIIQTHMLNS